MALSVRDRRSLSCGIGWASVYRLLGKYAITVAGVR
jgi:hypothetical protein